MFEKATKLKLRFVSIKGVLSVEELWDLPLLARNKFDLNTVAKDVSETLKNDEVNFVQPLAVKDTEAELRMSIVKHIIAVKLEAKAKAESAADKKAKQQKLMALIADKQDDVLKGKSVEELQKELDAL